MIPFSKRFHGHNSLRYVYKNGRIVRSRVATLKSTTNSHRKESRFAVVVSKKVMKGAVGRNKIRRRIYEHIRLNMHKIGASHDVVIIVTSSEVFNMTSADLSDQLEQLFTQANLYKTGQN